MKSEMEKGLERLRTGRPSFGDCMMVLSLSDSRLKRRCDWPKIAKGLALMHAQRHYDAALTDNGYRKAKKEVKNEHTLHTC